MRMCSSNHCIDCPNIRFVPKRTWGASYATQFTQTMEVPIPRAVVHPTNTNCWNVGTCSTVMRIIQAQHIRDNLHDIAYHFVIGADGSVYEGRGWFPRAALEFDQNERTLSLAFIGQQSPSGTMQSVLNQLIACAKSRNYLVASVAAETGPLHSFNGQQRVAPVLPSYDYNSSNDDYDYGPRAQPACPPGFGPGIGPMGTWMPCINLRYNYNYTG